MNTKPENLTSLGYVLDEELEHEKIVPFVRAYLKKPNPFSIFYWAFNLIALMAFGWMLGLEHRIGKIEALVQASLGVFLFLVILLPLHEIIHGLFYKIIGAKKVTFQVQWKQMVFNTIAGQFVAGRREFILVALAPFVIINSFLIAGMCLVPVKMMWVLFGTLILHTGGCFGDFGLVSYFYYKRKFHPCTYDDTDGRKTLFYIKKQPGQQPYVVNSQHDISSVA